MYVYPRIRQRASAADKSMNCSFCVNGNVMENVQEFSHLGHIIIARLDDAAYLIVGVSLLVCYATFMI